MRFLSSPRRRRRLAWTLGSLTGLACVIAVAILFWNTATVTPTPVEDTPIVTDAEPAAEPIAVTRAVRREIRASLEEFVDAAVLRRRVDRAWDLTTPTLRGGVTRAEWRRGELPIQPYPWDGIRAIDTRVLYSDASSVAVDVMLLPEVQSRPILVYTADLTPVRSGKQRRWLVDYWAPQASIGGGPPPEEAAERPERAAAPPPPEPQSSSDRGRLGSEWFLVPAAILALLVGIPVYIGVRDALAARRAQRRYRRELEADATGQRR